MSKLRTFNKLNKFDKNHCFFIIAMIGVLIMHLMCILGADHFADESLYPTVPLRLINGDSLVIDEWHVTQFVSLFLYIPVRFWLSIKGSTEGIILFMRFFYLIIHTIISVAIYIYVYIYMHDAKRYKGWATAAALIFYTQVPLRFLSANYHSLLALFLLLFTITLLEIYKRDNKLLYLVAGFFFGCCCVCNPMECIVYGLYIVLCIVWKRRVNTYKKKMPGLSETETVKVMQKCEIQKRFFSAKAFVGFSAGILIIAIISIAFFFGTGGTISGLLQNIPYLLSDSGHSIFVTPKKLLQTLAHFNGISLGVPFVLPVFYLVLAIDKKRKNINHKLVYTILSLALAIFYTIGVLVEALRNSRALAISLPLVIITSVCYILTENKNKKFFYCMWLPGVIATFVQYIASALHLSVFWVLTISNIAGIIFIKDFLDEILPKKESENDKTKKNKNIKKICQVILCVGICLQLVFQCTVYMIGRVVDFGEYSELQRGPYKGFYMNTQQLDTNVGMMNDLDIIKQRSNPDDPVYILADFSWMYLYLERPFATYSAWQPYLEQSRLIDYYAINPEKKPKYIYVGWVRIPTGVSSGHQINRERAENYIGILSNIYEFEQEELSYGVLLTVK